MSRRTKRKTARKYHEAPVDCDLLFDFGEESDATEYTVEEDSLLPKKYEDSIYDLSEYSEIGYSSVCNKNLIGKDIEKSDQNLNENQKYQNKFKKTRKTRMFKKYYLISLLALLFIIACVFYWIFRENRLHSFNAHHRKNYIYKLLQALSSFFIYTSRSFL
ncbi:unnamed protein product [Moneuplotes crassus]|uniref:Uncharacterized protein n=1 Tax=Euplotes crassus TaxID=5936 RepID=A0AAD2D3S3_EUPCR|nr:unnamed protein product [Moneuplotes crassus]